MAGGPYSDMDDGRTVESGARSPGAMIFLWVAWAAAAIFWGFVLTTGIGILNSAGGASASGDVGASGGGWAVMNMVGAAILGIALAYGALRYFTRDKRMDPVTEAATHAEYDAIEANGGEEPGSRVSVRSSTGDFRP